MLGHVHFGLKQYQEAFGAYSRTSSLLPNDGECLANLAGTCYQMQDRNLAYPYAARAVLLGATNHWALKQLALDATVAGNDDFATQRWQEAQTSYLWAASLAPADGTAQANLAGALLMLGHTQPARAAAAKAIELGFRGPHWVFDRLQLQ